MKLFFKLENMVTFEKIPFSSDKNHFYISDKISNYDLLTLQIESDIDDVPLVHIGGVYELFDIKSRISNTGMLHEISLFSSFKGKDYSMFEEMIGSVSVSIRSYGNDLIEPIHLKFEIISNKFETVEVLEMLRYVVKHTEVDQWNISPRLSKIELDSLLDKHSKTPIITLAKNVIESLERNINVVLAAPKSRLKPHYQLYSEAGSSGMVDDVSIKWAVSNLDRLSNVSDLQSWSVKSENCSYYFNDMLLNTTKPDYCVYENRIILGVIANLYREIKRCKNDLTEKENTGVSHFSRKIREIIKYSTVSYELELESLLQRISILHESMTQYLNNEDRIEERPKYTPVFAERIGYYDLFKPISEWYSADVDTEIGGKFLENIENINDLFEIYVFLKLLEGAKDQLGWKLLKAQAFKTNKYKIPDVWEFDSGRGLNIKIYFDTTIKLEKQDKIGLTLCDVLKQNPNRNINKGNHRPDFIIQITDESGFSTHSILDAKFSKSDWAFKNRLPDLIKKYDGRFGSCEGGVTGINLMGIICPGNDIHHKEIDFKSRIKHNYRSPYGFFDVKPHLPQRMSIDDHPNWKNDYSILFERLIDLHSMATKKIKVTTSEKRLNNSIGTPINENDVELLMLWLDGHEVPDTKIDNSALQDIYFKLKAREQNIINSRRSKKFVSPPVTEEMASIIKAMLMRGDAVQTIAAWFGINTGRVSEIKSGEKFSYITPANDLPPNGPYHSIGKCYNMLGIDSKA